MGGYVEMTHDELQDPANFEAGLREYLRLWQSSILHFARHWVPSQTSSHLNKTRYHYTSSKQNDVEKICRRLEKEFAIRLHATYARSGATEFNLKSISW